MPNPSLLRGAFARLGIAAALAAAALFAAVGPRLAHADESVALQWPCGPLERAREVAHALGGADFVTLTAEQWNFLRGVFVAAPDAPDSLPPGDHAILSLRPDGSASVLFVDGERACAPIKLPKGSVDILMSVGRGDIVHAGQGL